MGTVYYYANPARREWFPADALGGSAKFAGVGHGLTSRALTLLLVRVESRPPESGPVRVGRWSGEPVSLIGDSDPDWERCRDEFADLSADVALLVLGYDGFGRLGDAADGDDTLFAQLCHLAATRQAPELDPHLKSRFGVNYAARYREVCRRRTGSVPKDIARPGGGG